MASNHHEDEIFKAKRRPKNPIKFNITLNEEQKAAKEGSTEKLIRFGQQGVSGAGANPKTPAEKARQKAFKDRHAKNISKGKLSAAYWADKVKW